MKAWVLHDINDIRLETVEMPALERGEVLVAVKAAGICGSDIPRIYRTGAHRHPLIPGHEFSGVAVALGKDGDPGWLGKRVGVFPLIPCGTCAPCRKGQYEMCRNYGYLGSRRDGGFAEYAAVPGDNLIELPDSVSFEEAAMLEPMAVAAHAMRRVIPEVTLGNGREAADSGAACAGGRSMTAAAEKEGTIVVFGLGTIGMLLTALLLERGKSQEKSEQGGRVLTVGNKDFQKRKILELGLPEEAYCDSRTQDVSSWILERTEGCGADIIFECVGRNETLHQAVDNAAPAGRICLVGNPASSMALEKEVYWKILRNQLTVTGTWNSGFAHDRADDWHYALDRLSRKRIITDRFISHRLSLEELDRGLCIMRDKSQEYLKIMGRLY